MRTLEERKATSLNGVSGHILKECSQQIIKTKMENPGRMEESRYNFNLQKWKQRRVIRLNSSIFVKHHM